MLKILKPKYICTRPFSWLEVGASGQCHLCCPSWLNKPVGNIRNQTVEEVWNGKAAQEIRESMHDGSFRFCNDNCPFKRTKSNPIRERSNVPPEYRFVVNEKLTKLPYGPITINTAYDPTCNLSCPSCRKELIVAKGKAKESIIAIHEKLIPCMKQAITLNVTGSGDAFGSPLFRNFLRSINLKEYPNLVSIYIQTNGQKKCGTACLISTH